MSRFLALVAVLIALTAIASRASVEAAPPLRAPYVYDARISAIDGHGEPQIAVDRRDPRVIVAAYMSGASVSRDGGRHWRQFASTSNGGDTVAVSDAAGRLYYASLVDNPYTFLTSADHGRTWKTAGSPLRMPLAANQSASESVEPDGGPVYMGPSLIGCDRPLSGADANTGMLIASCSDHGDESGGESGDTWEGFFLTCRANAFSTIGMSDCGRRYVSVSRDHGTTWTDWQPEDSSDYPAAFTGGFGGIPVAAHGVLATAYVAGSAPRSNCSQCAVFETSTNGGRTWSRHLIPGATPQIDTWSATDPLSFLTGDPNGWAAQALVVDSQSVWFEPYVAADPSRAGRFAVMILDARRKHLLVYQTTDAGRTWRGPAALGDSVHRVDKPAIAYGPTGALGVAWKSVYASDLSFDVSAAVSPSGSLAFGRPAKLNATRSHEETCGQGGAQGQAYACDELSWVVMERDALDASWGDNRAGQAPWFGRYRFSSDPQFTAYS